jgi:hypothetical protein
MTKAGIYTAKLPLKFWQLPVAGKKALHENGGNYSARRSAIRLCCHALLCNSLLAGFFCGNISSQIFECVDKKGKSENIFRSPNAGNMRGNQKEGTFAYA